MAKRHQGNHRALTALAAVLTLVLVAAPAASGHPAHASRPSAARPQWILFTASPPNGAVEQIFRIKPSGSGLKQLTKGAFSSEAPAFSPDGKRIAFTRTGVGIFSMNADGSALRAVTKNSRDSYPAWSPDGKQIAFLRPLGSGWKVFVMSASGAGQRELSQAPPAGRPSWTSHGLLIPTNGDLAKIDPRSGHVDKLFGALIDAAVGMDTAAVSPDLSTIMFLGSRRLDPHDHGCGEGVPCPTYALFIENLRAHKAPRILVLNGGPASFSSDGTRIAFVGKNRLVVRDLANGTSKAIKIGKFSPTTGSPPVWQPR